MSAVVVWLVRDGDVLASAEIANGAGGRRKGLMGRDEVEGAFVIRPCRQVHTVGMRVPLDVAFCDVHGQVLHTCRLPPWRISRPVWRAAFVVEARAGAFERWGLVPGDRIEVRVSEQPVGALVLVGTPIGNLGDLSPRAVEVLRAADVIAAEDTRRTRALLTHAGIPAGGRVRSVHAHNEQEAAASVVDAVRAGKRVAYVTDAGMPGISDPGSRLVRACLDGGLPVEVVPGPSAALSALVLSGLPTERFVFEGFLPRRGRERKERLALLAADSRTTVLFESPRRVAATLNDLRALCGPLREVAVARELTKMFEDVWRGTLGDAVDLVAAGVARGEHVIVLGPAAAAPEANDHELEAHVGAALAEGLSARDAAVRVAADLGVPRRRAYDIANRLRKR